MGIRCHNLRLGHGPEIWAEYRDFEESQLSQLTGPERAQQVLKVRSGVFFWDTW